MASPPSSQPTLDATAAPAHEQVHQPTGYRWSKEEDAPGYLWKRKAAQRDAQTAWDGLLDKDRMVGTTYGDIGLEEAERRLRGAA